MSGGCTHSQLFTDLRRHLNRRPQFLIAILLIACCLSNVASCTNHFTQRPFYCLSIELVPALHQLPPNFIHTLGCNVGSISIVLYRLNPICEESTTHICSFAAPCCFAAN